jgi:hypothetical protein
MQATKTVPYIFPVPAATSPHLHYGMFSFFHEPNNGGYVYRSIKVILANIEFEFVWQKFEAPCSDTFMVPISHQSS